MKLIKKYFNDAGIYNNVLSHVLRWKFTWHLYIFNERIDIFHILQNDIAYYNDQCDIIIAGDFNARTSDSNDYLIFENNGEFNYIPFCHWLQTDL